MIRPSLLLLGGAALALAALASAPGIDPASALGAAVGAAGLASAALGLAVVDRAAGPPRTARPPGTDPIATLAESMRGSPFRRETAVQAIHSLEIAGGIRAAGSFTNEETRTVAGLPTAEFQRWMSEHLERLENAS
ncbi:MAG TPA: hypothetical protein VGV64_05415 [Thermoplasmata archaeon]|nr:hypothetical protein [Thermoplasmata archaeon]